jgi:hypothetical protein
MRTGPVALAGAATKSLILLNPGSREITLTEFAVSFDGSSAAASVGLEIYRVTTVGSPAGTTGTAVSTFEGLPAALSTGLTALTTEPTTVAVLKEWYLTPFGGTLHIQSPLGREVINTTSRLGLRYVSPTGVSPNARAFFEWEE